MLHLPPKDKATFLLNHFKGDRTAAAKMSETMISGLKGKRSVYYKERRAYWERVKVELSNSK